MMQPLTYLVFTILSIVIQFSVMDLIQEKPNTERVKPQIVDLSRNSSSQVKKISDVLKEYYSNKPHDHYYRHYDRMPLIFEKKAALSSQTFENLTNEEIVVTTQSTTEDILSSTAVTILLDDENGSMTDMPTSEASITTTEFENVTDLSIFGTVNSTTPKPTQEFPEETPNNLDCTCNLLFKICDNNCCCDTDCSIKQKEIFKCNLHQEIESTQDDYLCAKEDRNPLLIDSMTGLICVANTNLPAKRIANAGQYIPQDVDKLLEQSRKWSREVKPVQPVIFNKNKYTYGDPLWLLYKGSISCIDSPTASINNYCGARAPIHFLKDESWNCETMIQDLEMFNILKNIEETSIISVTDSSANTTVMNCSTMHCTNWTVLVCNHSICVEYDKNQHEPTCRDDFVCSGIAHKLEYVFHYFDGRIVNATIYMHTRNYFSKIPLIKQYIGVKFYIALNNETTNVVRLSGTPGYLKGFPVIVSFEKENHTDSFFSNRTVPRELHQPDNVDGRCVRSNITHQVLLFGKNVRRNCRIVMLDAMSPNATLACEKIGRHLEVVMNIHNSVTISPLGDPNGLEDQDWINIQVQSEPESISYGEYKMDNSTLFCSRILKRLSLVFGYADVSQSPEGVKLKILASKAAASYDTKTFLMHEVSTVITYDTVFVDVTKEPEYEYAGSPNLNIYLPKDFFFPFIENKNSSLQFHYLLFALTFMLCVFV